ncbi:MAG TPA: cysteine desulfurase [Methanocorpusculum sp.]|nr:cysteine desulfurase [Methanocorpusculum sp.]
MIHFDPESIRNDFPILEKLIYLDNAATTLSPKQVIEAQTTAEYYYRANVGRGIHRMSRMATHQYQNARETISQFLGGKQGGLVFTKNTTEAINIIAQGLHWKKTDRIITALQNHHSNLLPWYRIKNERRVASIDTLPLNGGTIDPSEIDAHITPDTRLVAIGHASNVFGTIAPVKAIADVCYDHDVTLLIDGAQAAPHLPIDLSKIGCDFFCFSGHKMLGPMGIGGLWISDSISEEDIPQPLLIGGGMVSSIKDTAFTPVNGPGSYEAGTPNVIGAIGLAAAVKYLSNLGMKKLNHHSAKLAKKMLAGLADIRGMRIYTPDDNTPLIGTVSFTVEGMHPHDVAYFLDEASGIMVRSGEHCCQPLMHALHLNSGTVRASAYCYNTEDDIDMLIATTEEISRMVK